MITEQSFSPDVPNSVEENNLQYVSGQDSSLNYSALYVIESNTSDQFSLPALTYFIPGKVSGWISGG